MKTTNTFTVQTQFDPIDRQLLETLLQKVEMLNQEISRIKGQKEPGWTTLREYTEELKKNGKKLPVSIVKFRTLRDEGKAPQMYGYSYSTKELDRFVDLFPDYTAPEFKGKENT